MPPLGVDNLGMHELEMLTARQLHRQVDAGYSPVVVPFGSLENHGGHLPLGADMILADAGGAQVAQRLGAVLAPAVRIGDSVRRQELFGRLSLTIAPPDYGCRRARPGVGAVRLRVPRTALPMGATKYRSIQRSWI